MTFIQQSESQAATGRPRAQIDPGEVDEGWGPVAERLFEIVRDAGHIPPTSKSIIAELADKPASFIQSCEHGKLSGQWCRECNRNVPYGPAPQ